MVYFWFRFGCVFNGKVAEIHYYGWPFIIYISPKREEALKKFIEKHPIFAPPPKTVVGEPLEENEPIGPVSYGAYISNSMWEDLQAASQNSPVFDVFVRDERNRRFLTTDRRGADGDEAES